MNMKYSKLQSINCTFHQSVYIPPNGGSTSKDLLVINKRIIKFINNWKIGIPCTLCSFVFVKMSHSSCLIIYLQLLKWSNWFHVPVCYNALRINLEIFINISRENCKPTKILYICTQKEMQNTWIWLIIRSRCIDENTLPKDIERGHPIAEASDIRHQLYKKPVPKVILLIM